VKSTRSARALTPRVTPVYDAPMSTVRVEEREGGVRVLNLLHVHLLTLAAWTLGLLHRGGLAATYAATVVALALLYPLCDRYRAYKQAHPDGRLRYV